MEAHQSAGISVRSTTVNDPVSVSCDSGYLSKGTRFGFNNRNFIPVRLRIFFSPSDSDRTWGSHGFLSRGCWVSFQRVKRIVQGGHHQHPLSPHIWYFTPKPPASFNGVAFRKSKLRSRICPTMQYIIGPVMRMLGLSPSASLVYYFNTTFALLVIWNGWVL